jgi:hypothetical protein
MQRMKIVFGFAIMVLALCVSGARAQAPDTGYTLRNPMYDIHFPAKWSLVFQPSFMGKNKGFEGLAYVACAPGTALPNADSQAVFYASILGGHIQKSTAVDTVIGKYKVHRQNFTYDSLPRLDSLIKEKSAPLTFPKHKNGSFRVYSVVSDGFVFAVAGLATIPAAIPPYADIEKAIVTLVLHPGAGVRPYAAAAGAGLWLRDGILGGGWLKAHPPASVECFDARGALAGEGRPAGGETWLLPVSRGSFFVRIRSYDGISLILPASR